jgi:hypothetical protein
LQSQSELLDRIRGLLGGRASEELVFGEVSTGAKDDLQRATMLAREMVSVYGMGESAGLMGCAEPEPLYAPATGSRKLDCSNETAREIDIEVKQLLAGAYADARRILEAHRTDLDTVASELLRKETLREAEFRHLIGQDASGGRRLGTRAVQLARGGVLRAYQASGEASRARGVERWRRRHSDSRPRITRRPRSGPWCSVTTVHWFSWPSRS